MKIRKLLQELKKHPENMIIKNLSLDNYGTTRGNYFTFYVGYNLNKDGKITNQEFVSFLENKVIGNIFCGHKGGVYAMGLNSQIRIGDKEGNDPILKLEKIDDNSILLR